MGNKIASPVGDSLGQRAFTTVCDYYAKDAAAKNELLRSENKSLKLLEDELFAIEIYTKRDGISGEDDKRVTLIRKDIHAFSEVDGGQRLAYTCSEAIECPLNDIRRMNFLISGVKVHLDDWIRIHPKFMIDQKNVVRIQVDFCKHIRIEGRIVNFRGTIENVRDFIKSNRAAVHLMTMGMRVVETGEPVTSHLSRLGENYLESATLLLDKLFVAKSLKPVLSSVNERNVSDKGGEEITWAELSRILPSHRLRFATKDHEMLRNEHKRLLRARDLFQSFTVTTPDQAFNLNLRDGRVKTTYYGGHKAWVLEPEVGTVIQFSHISHLLMRLSGIEYSYPREPSYVDQFSFSQDGGIFIQFYGNGIEAIFFFTNTLTEDIINSLGGDLQSHLQTTLVGGDAGPLKGITVDLARIAFRIDSKESIIKKKLDILGIDTSTIDERGPG